MARKGFKMCDWCNGTEVEVDGAIVNCAECGAPIITEEHDEYPMNIKRGKVRSISVGPMPSALSF